MFTLQHRKVN